MKVLLIDGQGGKIGRQLAESILHHIPDVELMAVGTNSTATASMIKSGVNHAATGENAVIVACRKADVIIGPIGVVIADSLYGEVTPKMAVAVAQADAIRILIPVNKCENIIAGVQNISTTELLEDVILRLKQLVENRR
ncbi:MAG TPA: hypothetical protein DER23_07085 [Clostridiales bacterium]|jgi:prephenate dehydrogenase|nr:hypothetical protein [Clostridiales bacterium]